MASKKKKAIKKKPVKLTTKEIEDLMGIHRPIYKRAKGGALKQKS